MNNCNYRDVASVYSLNSRKFPGHFSYSLGTRLVYDHVAVKSFFMVTSSPSMWLHQVVLKQICQNLSNALFSHFTISLTFCKPYSTECGWFPWLLRSLYLILLMMRCSIIRWGVQGRAQERLERWETRVRVFVALLLYCVHILCNDHRLLHFCRSNYLY